MSVLLPIISVSDVVTAVRTFLPATQLVLRTTFARNDSSKFNVAFFRALSGWQRFAAHLASAVKHCTHILRLRPADCNADRLNVASS